MSYLFATIYRDISEGHSLFESLSWSLLREVAASRMAVAARTSVDCNSLSLISTTFLTNLIHLRRDVRIFCGFERSQTITTAVADKFCTVIGTSSSFGSEISPPIS